MDRDRRWDRTEKLIVLMFTVKETIRPIPAGLGEAYSRGETDEFVQPVVITGQDGTRLDTIRKTTASFSLTSVRTGSARLAVP